MVTAAGMAQSSAAATGFSRFRWELALALIVLGARWWTFAYAGSPLPYYDQWVAEFNNTFYVLSQGHSLWSVLFMRHNEHVLLTTKLVSLLGFTLNGYWDVRFLACVAGVVRAIEAALVFRLLAGGAERIASAVIWISCLVVFATPISGFNELCGLQVSFYFADLATIGAIVCVLRWPASRWEGTLGLVAAMALGLFSMGSALAIPAATLAVHLVDRRPRRGFWPAWGATALLALVYVLAFRDAVQARTAEESILMRAGFFLRVLSWPFDSAIYGAVLVGAVAAALVWTIRTHRVPRPVVAAIAGFGGYAVVNAFLIAWNRPPSDFHPRHWEMVALVPLSFTALGAVAVQAKFRTRRIVGLIGVVIAFGYVWSLLPIWQENWRYIVGARQHRAQALEFYRGVLTSRRMIQQIDAINLRLGAKDSFLDDPILRFTPHPGVYANIIRDPLPALGLLSPEILPARDKSFVTLAVERAMSLGWMAIVAGVLAAVVALFGAVSKQASASTLTTDEHR